MNPLPLAARAEALVRKELAYECVCLALDVVVEERLRYLRGRGKRRRESAPTALPKWLRKNGSNRVAVLFLQLFSETSSFRDNPVDRLRLIRARLVGLNRRVRRRSAVRGKDIDRARRGVGRPPALSRADLAGFLGAKLRLWRNDRFEADELAVPCGEALEPALGAARRAAKNEGLPVMEFLHRKVRHTRALNDIHARWPGRFDALVAGTRSGAGKRLKTACSHWLAELSEKWG